MFYSACGISSLACQTLAVSQLDSVIIAPPGPVEGESQTLAHLQPAWEELEALVRSQQIAAIGTSDLDKDLLEQLYNWAQVSGNHQTGHSVIPGRFYLSIMSVDSPRLSTLHFKESFICLSPCLLPGEAQQ